KKGKRYRYYVCSNKQSGLNAHCLVGTITASEVEDMVIAQILKLLQKPEIITRIIADTAGEITDNHVISSMKNIEKVWGELFPAEQARIMHLLIKKVKITPDGIDINIYSQGIYSLTQELEVS
ncbi:MAG: zinc ribbon domain-containing protein, partial [Pseudomonadota bacterium]